MSGPGTWDKARAVAIGAVALALLCGSPSLRAQPGTLFPEPFRVEHHLVRDDGDGNRFVGEPVVDTYGGTWIVSQRPDGSRLIVDLARRELTEVRTEKGTYWTTSFEGFAELQARLRRVQGLATTAGTEEDAVAAGGEASRRSATAAARESEADAFVVTELEPGSSTAPALAGAATWGATAASTATEAAAATSTGQPPRRLRVAHPEARTPGDALEVWVDPQLRLGPGALAALAALDEALAGPRDAGATAVTQPGRFVAAARSHAAGALVVRTARPAGLSPSGEPLGRIEDVATRVERLERFPAELVEIPEGLRRVPHPLEATVRFLAEEAARDAAMAGAGQGSER